MTPAETLAAPRPAEEAKGFPWGGVAWTAIGVLLAVLLFVRRSVGGVDQWMFPVLWTVRVCYGAAVVLYLASLRWRALRLATGAMLLGFTTSLFLVVTRGLEARRWPSQSKFEVFFNTSMTIPAALLLLTWAFGLASAEGRKRVAGALVGAVFAAFALTWVLIAGGQDFDIQELPPALQSYWFPPHVSSYMLAYSGVFSAALVAIVHLVATWRATRLGLPFGTGTLPGDLDTFVYRIVGVAFPLLTSGLFLGALWGEAAWADYWFWDIKETWAFISWLVLLGYLHLRMIAGWSGWKMSLYVLLGAIAVGITYVAVQLLPASIASEHVYN
jgi:ABC-type transport system involved in cytochrome c biogenesis permease subunit